MSRVEPGLLSQTRVGAIADTGNKAASPPPPSQRPRHPFDSRARVVLSATLVAGGLVAGAPAMPLAVRAPVLFIALVAWAAAVAWGTAHAARLAARPLRRDFATAATVLGAIGLAAAVLASTQLEIIRALQHRPALTWNIDWRFHLNHAQAIARFGGVDSALDYAGAPVAYHVGPAWLAGATERVLGRGVYLVSFGLLPLLCVLTMAIAALYLLHTHGVRYRLAAAATGIALTLPGLENTPRGLYETLAGAPVERLSDLWSAASGPGVMLNIFFGLAVAMAVVALLLDRRSRGWHLALATIGLASLVELKPQFFLGVGLFVGWGALEHMIGRKAPAPRAHRMLGAGVAAFALALALTAALPRSVYWSVFGQPIWAPGRTGYQVSDVWTNAALLFGLAAAAWAAPQITGSQRRILAVATGLCIALAVLTNLRVLALLSVCAVALTSLHFLRGQPASRTTPCYGLLMRAAAGMATLVTILCLIGFPVRADVVAQMQRIVEPAFSALREQPDLAEGLGPLRLLLVTSALGLIVVCAAQSSGRWRRAFCVAGAVTVASPLPLVAFYFLQPLRGYEAAEDVGLLETLRAVPRDSRLLIASDLADPAGNYSRPLRAFLLTGYTGHTFYVANVRYVHHVRSDAPERLAQLRAFFGSPWSPWHDGWLQRTGIGYVLVSDRCPPAWLNQVDVPLRPLAHHGHWAAYEIPSRPLVVTRLPMPTAADLTPRFGVQGCLSFRAARP